MTSGSVSTLSVAVGAITTLDDEFSPISVEEVTFGQFKEGASLSGKKVKDIT